MFFRWLENKYQHKRRNGIFALCVCLFYAYSAEKFFGIASITGAAGYNGGYYNGCYNNYYNPYLAAKQEEARKAQEKELRRQHSEAMKLLSKAAHAVDNSEISEETYHALTVSLVVDFVFIFLSFISYLWVDDIQTKVEKKKSIDDSLNWFWAKV